MIRYYLRMSEPMVSMQTAKEAVSLLSRISQLIRSWKIRSILLSWVIVCVLTIAVCFLSLDTPKHISFRSFVSEVHIPIWAVILLVSIGFFVCAFVTEFLFKNRYAFFKHSSGNYFVKKKGDDISYCTVCFSKGKTIPLRIGQKVIYCNACNSRWDAQVI